VQVLLDTIHLVPPDDDDDDQHHHHHREISSAPITVTPYLRYSVSVNAGNKSYRLWAKNRRSGGKVLCVTKWVLTNFPEVGFQRSVCSVGDQVTVTVTGALVLRPLLKDRGRITESIRILVPVDRMKQRCFQITTFFKQVRSIAAVSAPSVACSMLVVREETIRVVPVRTVPGHCVVVCAAAAAAAVVTVMSHTVFLGMSLMCPSRALRRACSCQSIDQSVNLHLIDQ